MKETFCKKEVWKQPAIFFDLNASVKMYSLVHGDLNMISYDLQKKISYIFESS